jgi:peptide methionine sulfoxide reductase MsrA
MIVNPNYLVGKDSFIGENGIVNADSGYIQTDMTNTEYSNVSISITGFRNAQDISLVIALYAYTEGGEIEYIQSQTTACADKSFTIGETTLYTVTFESVKNANSSLDNLDEFVIPTNKEQE